MGNSALAVASFTARLREVTFLLKNGANPENPDRAGRTPLVATCYAATYLAPVYGDLSDHWSVVRLLINEGADVNAFDNEGRSALSYIAEIGAHEMAIHLLSKGADPKAAFKPRTPTALWFACGSFYKGADKIVQALLDKGESPIETKYRSRTCIKNAVLEKNEPVIRVLIKSKYRDAVTF